MSSDPGLAHGAPPTAPPQPWPSAPGYGQGSYAGGPGYQAPSGYDQGVYGGSAYGAPPPPPSNYGQPPPPSSASRYSGQPAPASSAQGYAAPPPPATGPAPAVYGQPPGSTYAQASAPPYGQPGYAQGPPQYASPSYGQPTPSGYGQPAPSQPGYGQQQPWPQQQQHQAFAPPHMTGYNPYGQQGAGYGFTVAELFPPGTDPEIVRMFQQADRDGSGMVEDEELQKVLTVAAPFSIRTVHLLILYFSASGALKIRPLEFANLWKSIKEWRKIFDEHDRDRSGRMDTQELANALLKFGCSVPPSVLKILVSRYDRSGHAKSIDLDNFIECALLVKGLTDKFKEKDVRFQGSATLTYEEFMLMVVPYLAA